MPSHASEPSNDIRLVQDETWSGLEDFSRLDPRLRSALALIDRRHWYQLFERTGIRWAEKGNPDGPQEHLPLLIEFSRKAAESGGARQSLERSNLEVADAFFREGLPTHCATRIPVLAVDPRRVFPKSGSEPKSLRQELIDLLNNRDFIARVELPGSAQAFGVESLEDIGLAPGGRRSGAASPDGSGVIVGIIDDGCAFAHPNFLREGAAGAAPTSRILRLWDQGRDQGETTGGWTAPNGYPYGLELTGQQIDAVLSQPGFVNNGVVDEDKVYRHFGHVIADLAAHGTHVMDIAAGNGRAPMSTPGIAPNADIILVQLPAASIERGRAALDADIVAGVRYIFERAGAEGKPVVINISYGGYAGPHDGRSFVEQAIDAELGAQPNRAVVVAAGNGFAADCHAGGRLPAGRGRNLRWIVKPEDPTTNLLEVWYDATAQLELVLTPPGGTQLAPVPLGALPLNIESNGQLIGTVDHQSSAAPSGLNRITVILNPTGSAAGSVIPPLAPSPPAPSGTWTVRLRNVGTKVARWDAWIERDTAGRAGGTRRMQSHFHPDDAVTHCTLSGYATGKLTLTVGAYNTATQQVCRYSACGPTRDGRRKPEVLAPAEEDAAGRGILSASSRSALPTRMNGTSASAPQVAGLVALLFQAATEEGLSLTAAEVQQRISAGASDAQLLPSAHVEADSGRRDKQGNVSIWPHLTGKGKVNWPATPKPPP